MERYREIEKSIIKKYRKEIWSKFIKAIKDYKLIQENDKIMVCISGGKDSFLLAKCIQELIRHGMVPFEAKYVVMNPGYNDLNYQVILNNAKLMNIPITVFKTDIFDTVADIPNNPCYLCARMRRGYLYSKAKELGCNKIALGHHYDDVIETILMGMLHSTNFEGMELIRPLYLIREEDIIHWKDYNDLKFIACACRMTEELARNKASSSQNESLISKRAEVKRIIHSIALKDPIIEKNIFRSVENVNLNTVIAYKQDGVKHHFLDDY